MKRGDFVTVAVPGDYGKPGPALIIQSDLAKAHDSVTMLLLSSTLIDSPLIRINVLPDSINGLGRPSQIMIDKIMTAKRTRIGKALGRASEEIMLEVNRCLIVFLGIAR